ncbi:MAG: hypothetical protein LBU23_13540 [Planctomycetota bacterium]|nr:hypothetical protein [Planctomycetota bacterium]
MSEGCVPDTGVLIALALQQGWREVAIYEAVGRSVARMCQLRLTGSLGILIRAKRHGYAIMLADAIARIGLSGIWIGEDVKRAALRAAEELPDAADPGHEKQ